MLITLFGCANQQQPTGGPKDETPPRLTLSVPKNNTTNYKGTQLVLEFDEYIKANQLKKELIISPNTELKYKSRVKKNILEIEFMEPLLDSTTYSFFFGKSVVDITEGNPVDSLRIAFSTWEILDTLSIKGKVMDYYSAQPIQEALVALYFPNDTSKIFGKKKPLYYTKTDDEGNFNIPNLSPKEYSLFALKETNDNFQYDKPNEKIGFLSFPLRLIDNDSLPIYLKTYDIRNFEFKGGKSRKGFYEFQLTKGLLDYSAEISENIDSVYFMRTSNSLRLYNLANNFRQDSLGITISARDSANSFLEINTKFILSKYEGNPDLPSFDVAKAEPKTNSFIKGDKVSLTLNFSRPVKQFFPDSAFMVVGTKDTTSISSLDINWNIEKTSIQFPKLVLDSTTIYVFKAASAISIFNDTLTSKQINFSIKDPSEYGSLEGKIETEKPSFVVQLCNENGTMEQEIWNEKEFKFTFVSPGMKLLRVVVDENSNGKWDQGNILKNIPPETIIHYPDLIEIKANWEVVDENLILKF